VTWPRPFQGRFVIHMLGLTMFDPHIKFEMSTITCNEKMKGIAKSKNSRFENCLIALTAAALSSEI